MTRRSAFRFGPTARALGMMVVVTIVCAVVASATRAPADQGTADRFTRNPAVPHSRGDLHVERVRTHGLQGFSWRAVSARYALGSLSRRESHALRGSGGRAWLPSLARRDTSDRSSRGDPPA